MRLLIIDHDAHFRTTARALFAAFGHGAVEARAVAFVAGPLQRGLFDLVVTQLHDRALTVAVIMAIRAHTSIPLLFIGRRGAPEIPDEFAGLAESIIAPFSIDGLPDRIAALMIRHHELARLHAALR
jgi:DNA-binding response OmpR family regulator